jgi:3-deoxy-D-manno-octulosonic-acid transferase
MPFSLLLYNLLSGIIFLFGFPFLLLYNLSQGRYSDRLVERLGRYPLNLKPDETSLHGRPIWIHAVSVGEVKAAVSLTHRISEQLPDVPLLFSTTTPAGRETAEKLLGDKVPIIYFPLDIYLCVKRALTFFRPRLFIALETELWPNFIYISNRLGCQLALVNGRISDRSFQRYLKIKWLLKPLLKRFSLLLVRHPEDARRLIDLGALVERTRVLGNIKADGLIDEARRDLETKLRQRLRIPPDSRVWVAGSTRGGEEEPILEIYSRLRESFSDLILVLAPRHLNRMPHIEDLVRRRGLPHQLYSRILAGPGSRQDPIILVDRMGDLFALYSLATVVFCGASLVPKGGQNILEPAAWGKVVFYGPHMEDFRDARSLLEEAGAGIVVRDAQDLAEKLEYYLSHHEIRKSRGRAGQQALESQRGLTAKAAELIAALVKNTNHRFNVGMDKN